MAKSKGKLAVFLLGAFGSLVMYAAYFLRQPELLDQVETYSAFKLVVAGVAFVTLVVAGGLWALLHKPRQGLLALASGMSVPGMVFGAELALANPTSKATGASMVGSFALPRTLATSDVIDALRLVFTPITTARRLQREAMLQDRERLENDLEREVSLRSELKGELEAEIQERDEALNDLRTTHAKEIAEMRSEVEQAISEAKSQCDALAATTRLLETRAQELQVELNTANSDTAELKESVSELEGALRAKEADLKGLSQELGKLKDRERELELDREYARQAFRLASGLVQPAPDLTHVRPPPDFGKIVDRYESLLKGGTREQRIAAACALGTLGTAARSALPTLQEAARGRDEALEKASSWALREIQGG